MTHDYETYGPSARRDHGRRPFRDDVQSYGERFLRFLRTRTTEQWFYVLAGFCLGLLLG